MKISASDFSLSIHGREALFIPLSMLQSSPTDWSSKVIYFEVDGVYRTRCLPYPADASKLVLTLTVDEVDQLPLSAVSYILRDETDPTRPSVVLEASIRRTGYTAQPTVIDDVPTLTISGAPVSPIVGASTIFQPSISGGYAPLTLSLIAGSLPAGRSISGLTITGPYTTAASSSYTIRVSDGVGHQADLTVSETVAAHSPMITVLPVVTGVAQADSTLTASTGSWAYSPTSFSYQWNRDGVAISGATASSYTLTISDIGHAITVTVQASNSGGSSTSTSAPTASVAVHYLPPANSVAPTISGPPSVGVTLTVANGTWTNSPTGYSFQWYRGLTTISGSTSATYLTTSSDLNQSISCTVTATNQGGAVSAISNAISITYIQPYNRLFTAAVGDSRPNQDGNLDTYSNGDFATGYTIAENASGVTGWMHQLSGGLTARSIGPNLGKGGEPVEYTLSVPRPANNAARFNATITGNTMVVDSAVYNLYAGVPIGDSNCIYSSATSRLAPNTVIVSGDGRSGDTTFTLSHAALTDIAAFEGGNVYYSSPNLDLAAIAASKTANVVFLCGTNSGNSAISDGGTAQVAMNLAIRALTDPTFSHPAYNGPLPLYQNKPKNLMIIDEEPQGVSADGTVNSNFVRDPARLAALQSWVNFVRKYDHASGDPLANPHCKVIKLWDDPRFLDISSGASHYNKAGLLADGAHSAPPAAFLIGTMLAEAAKQVLDPNITFVPPLVNASQSNTTACVSSNPCFLGNSGQSGVSTTLLGSIPDHWELNGSLAGGTITFTQNALGGNQGNELVIRVQNPTNAGCNLVFSNRAGPLPVMDLRSQKYRLAHKSKLNIASGNVVTVGSTVYMNLPNSKGFSAGTVGDGSHYYGYPANTQYFKQDGQSAEYPLMDFVSPVIDPNASPVNMNLSAGQPNEVGIQFQIAASAGAPLDMTYTIRQARVVPVAE